MATPNSTIPSLHPQPKFPAFHYTRRQVALMIRIATLGTAALDELAAETGEDSLKLESMAAGKLEPSPAVLARLQIEHCGRGFSWLAL